MPEDGDLKRAERAYQRAATHAEQLRRERNQVVGEAIDAGWTFAQIAAATGLSRGRIGQIAQSRTPHPRIVGWDCAEGGHLWTDDERCDVCGALYEPLSTTSDSSRPSAAST